MRDAAHIAVRHAIKTLWGMCTCASGYGASRERARNSHYRACVLPLELIAREIAHSGRSPGGLCLFVCCAGTKIAACRSRLYANLANEGINYSQLKMHTDNSFVWREGKVHDADLLHAPDGMRLPSGGNWIFIMRRKSEFLCVAHLGKNLSRIYRNVKVIAADSIPYLEKRCVFKCP